MRVTPLRALNENRMYFGLNLSDGAAIGILFVFANILLEGTPYEIFSLMVIPLPLPFLIPIRLMNRRKMIRDWLTSLFLPRRLYDPKLVSRV